MDSPTDLHVVLYLFEVSLDSHPYSTMSVLITNTSSTIMATKHLITISNSITLFLRGSEREGDSPRAGLAEEAPRDNRRDWLGMSHTIEAWRKGRAGPELGR